MKTTSMNTRIGPLFLTSALVLIASLSAPLQAEDIQVFSEGPRQLKAYKVPNIPKAAAAHLPGPSRTRART